MELDTEYEEIETLDEFVDSSEGLAEENREEYWKRASKVLKASLGDLMAEDDYNLRYLFGFDATPEDWVLLSSEADELAKKALDDLVTVYHPENGIDCEWMWFTDKETAQEGCVSESDKIIEMEIPKEDILVYYANFKMVLIDPWVFPEK